MGIILGLAAALLWGSADFFACGACRRIGSFRTLLYMQFVGFVGVGAYLLVSGELPQLLAQTSAEDWAWAVFFALLNMISSLALYRAFEITTAVSIVSPIAASYGAITVVLAFLSGETVTAVRGAGILLALFGGVLAATNFEAVVSRRDYSAGRFGGGIGLAMFSAVGYGVAFWLLGVRVTPALGGVAPVVVARLTTIICLTAIALLRGLSLRVADRTAWPIIIAVGVLDTTAFVANAIGLTTDQISVVTVLASLFTAVTVVLSWIFFKERLARSQLAGIVLILAGIVLVSL